MLLRRHYSVHKTAVASPRPTPVLKVFARLFKKAAAGSARSQTSRFIHRRVKSSPGDNVGKKVGRTTTLLLFEV